MLLCIITLSSVAYLGTANLCQEEDCLSSMGLLQLGVTVSNRATAENDIRIRQNISTPILVNVDHQVKYMQVASRFRPWMRGKPFIFWSTVVLLIVVVSLIPDLRLMLAKLWEQSAQESPEESLEKQSAGQPSSDTTSVLLPSLLYGFLFMVTSATLIKYNDYLMSDDRFPFAVNLAMGHQASGFVSLLVLQNTKPSLFPSLVRLDQHRLFRYVLPISVCFSVDLVLSNSAYIYASVAFLQMMKEGNLVLVYSMSLMAGLELFHGVRARILLCLLLASALTMRGQLDFSVTAFTVKGLSQFMEALRVILTAMLLSVAGSNRLDPLSFNLLVQGITAVLEGCYLCACFACIPSIAIASWADYVAWAPHLMVNCGIALPMNVASVFLISYTSAIGFHIVGLIRDIAVFVCDVLISGTPVTTLQEVGFGLQAFFVLAYCLHKRFQKQLEPQTSPFEGETVPCK